MIRWIQQKGFTVRRFQKKSVLIGEGAKKAVLRTVFPKEASNFPFLEDR
jgi:hypothetical protein